MKWLLIGLLCLSCSTTWVRAQAAGDIYNKAIGELNNNQFDAAAADFDTIIKSYPTFAQIDEAHILGGRAYLFASKYAEAIDRLQKEADPSAKPALRGTGLFLTALAQFFAAQKSNDSKMYTADVATLTALTDFIAKNPTPDNKTYLEQALYYRALANFGLDNYTAAVTDLNTLTTDPQFATSLQRPDYFLLLGSAYASQTNDAVGKKAAPDTILALSDKAIAAYDLVINDPNALVSANEASMQKANLDFLLAQLAAADPDKSAAAYQKALDAFRKVKRKDDLIKFQQDRLDQLRKNQADAAAAAAAAPPGGATYNNQTELTINREQGRLDGLQKAPDPIIEALIRMAECYVNLKQPDEARTILHRVARAKLTDDQQKEVDFQILYSYVLGGQTDAADKALSAYLAKHAGDPQAAGLSAQIAAKLLDRKDYQGALKQALQSLKDFPNGPAAGNAITLEAQALTGLGRIKESNAVADEYLKANPTSPLANSLLLSRAANESSSGDLPSTLVDYGKVKDNASADADTQAAAALGYIETLQKLERFDEVIQEAKTYETKFPTSKQLGYVMLFGAQALDRKNDPTAVLALQDVARKFPQDPVIAPLALYYVVENYRRAKNLPLMTQAAKDLQAACPTAYPQIMLADTAVADALVGEKKFDDAAAIYEPLTKTSDAAVAAEAQNKIGDVRFAQAKTFHYLSLPPAGTPGVTVTRADAEKVLDAAAAAYVDNLKTRSDQLTAVGNSISGMVNVAKLRRTWGLLKEDSDMEGYLTSAIGTTSGEVAARIEMAKAGLVFVSKNGAAQFPAALDRFKKVTADNPGVKLTRQETENFGELLLAAKDYDGAAKVYGDLLAGGSANDTAALGTAYYGLGAVAFGQGNVAKAKDYFLKLEGLPDRGAWHPHIMDASFVIALADEQSGKPEDITAAQAIYGQIMKSPQAGGVLQTKALLGYGRLLEKAGNAINPTAAGPNEYAIHYYLQPNLMFATATPEQSAEGLYLAGQAYDKAGDKANAKKQYDTLIATYATVAPDWVAKAKAAEGQ